VGKVGALAERTSLLSRGGKVGALSRLGGAEGGILVGILG